MGAPNFVPLGTVPEGYQAQAPVSGISYRTLSTSDGIPAPGIDAFGNIPGMMGTEMEVDGVNLWWDQSFGTFDMEVIDPNANVGVEPYHFEHFSFGYGAGTA